MTSGQDLAPATISFCDMCDVGDHRCDRFVWMDELHKTVNDLSFPDFEAPISIISCS